MLFAVLFILDDLFFVIVDLLLINCLLQMISLSAYSLIFWMRRPIDSFSRPIWLLGVITTSSHLINDYSLWLSDKFIFVLWRGCYKTAPLPYVQNEYHIYSLHSRKKRRNQDTQTVYPLKGEKNNQSKPRESFSSSLLLFIPISLTLLNRNLSKIFLVKVL